MIKVTEQAMKKLEVLYSEQDPSALRILIKYL
jgi:Fe-S cluster assembly iron-binding protein IscA